ncbi:MAG: hypothetical protein ACT4TC_11590 [Myxococcaceae bacterium]
MRALSFLLLWSSVASAQTLTTPIPEKHIPAPVLMELRALESQFDLALSRDCAPERCVSKGCSYKDHAVVDLPRSSSLPGLGQSEGLGSVPPQEYLTQARCEFAHEKSINAKDVQALTRRLEQRLSKGWLQVTLGRQVLEPISPSLSESPPPKPEVAAAPVKESAPLPPQRWEAGVALRELWVSLLPHFAWMIAVVMVTAATLLIIWGLRRVGKESFEERAMLAQLAAGTLEKSDDADEPKTEPMVALPVAEAQPLLGTGDNVFIEEQHRVWKERIAQTELANNEGAIVELLRKWLKAGEFELLAKAILVFGDRLSLAFSSDGELAVRKVEFAEYLRGLDESRLPSEAQFFKTLNQHAISSSLLSQSDAEVYLSLREEFGTTGVAYLVESLSPRHGALLFAQVPPDAQREVAQLFPPELKLQVAGQLLRSNRISREERTYVFEALDAARARRPLPAPPRAEPHDIADRGRQFDAAGALSVLLPLIGPEDRGALFSHAMVRTSGTMPRWYEDILYPDMLLKLPNELQADLLLDVDVRGLAGWSSVQNPAWQERFLKQLPQAMQNAVRAGMDFPSRAEQQHRAKQGHGEIVTALKRLTAQGKLAFADLVA